MDRRMKIDRSLWLASFDKADPNGVFAAFAAGCASIIQHPYQEKQSDALRGVLGLFDVSARPFVPADTLTFAVPMAKLNRMIASMEESFLITESWVRVRKRIAAAHRREAAGE
jgi:hypothetical protein